MSVKMRVKQNVSAITAAVVVSMGACAAVVGAGSADAATLPGGTWGLNQTFPGQTVLNAVSCTAPGDCVAVGYSVTRSGGTASDVPIAVTEKAGTWGSAQRISGAASLRLNTGQGTQLTSVSCGATGYCTAAGTYNGTDVESHAWYVTETKGTWGKATALSQAGEPVATASAITGVSCPAAGYCDVVGNYAVPTGTGGSTTPVPFLLDQANGTWGAPRSVPGLSGLPTGTSSAEIYPLLESVSCAARGVCTAGGGYIVLSSSPFQVGVPFEVSETNGAWGMATALSDPSGGPAVSEITSVSCPDAADCTVAGLNASPLAVGADVFTIDKKGGTWGTESVLAGQQSQYGVSNVTLACASAGDCVLASMGETPTGNNTVLDVSSETSSGHWGPLASISLGSTGTVTGNSGPVASCARGGDCTIVANLDYANKNHTFAVTSTGGVFGKARQVVPATSTAAGNTEYVTGLDCPRSGYCTLVYYLNSSRGFVSEAATEATAATVTLKASAPAVTAFSGKSLTVSFTVTVTSRDGTPGGTVSVRKNGTVLAGCSGKALTAGKAACRAKTGILAPGRYTLTAVYSGNAGFASSASAARYLTVTRARTRTSLALSKTAVAYGHENAAKLTVKVSHVGSVYATGKVAVRSGKTTLCTITLNKGTGSCKLSAKRLKKGSYKLAAVYTGNGDYSPSTSPGKALKVVA